MAFLLLQLLSDNLHRSEDSVTPVGSCTNYRPLQHPNIKPPCNNDKRTTGGWRQTTHFSMWSYQLRGSLFFFFWSPFFLALVVVWLGQKALSWKHLALRPQKELWSCVVFIPGPDAWSDRTCWLGQARVSHSTTLCKIPHERTLQMFCCLTTPMILFGGPLLVWVGLLNIHHNRKLKARQRNSKRMGRKLKTASATFQQ